ncbi:MAG: hypothetical protein MJZ21_02980 [archaeon]|nr:hypothetical protein [archaeon]
MIAITGDTRGIEALYQLSQNDIINSMSKSDFLLILGKCGITEAHTDFHENILMYRDLPCSIMFLDGPHDDYDLLSDHPVFPWNGGMTQNISRSITHLMRGQVFTMGGKTFLTMGGGTTPGRDDFGKYYTWWPEQDIFPQEILAAEYNLAEHGNKVDYVFTCECPTSWKSEISGFRTSCSDSLEHLMDKVEYRHWYFSDIVHHELPEHSATALYQEVIVLE